MDSSGRLILMAVHAHPDDETISMGGTLATYAAAHSPKIKHTPTCNMSCFCRSDPRIGMLTKKERDWAAEQASDWAQRRRTSLV